MQIQPTPLTSPTQVHGTSTVLVTLAGADLSTLLHPGEVVRATVTEVVNGQATLSLPGVGPIRLPALANLRPGVTVSLRLKSLQPQPVLELSLPGSPGLTPLYTTSPEPGAPPSLPAPLVVTTAAPQQLAASSQRRVLQAPGQQGGLPLPSAQTTVSQPAPLQPGQQLTVQVLGAAPGGKLLVQVNGRPLVAVTEQSFPAGTELDVHISQVQPEVVLRVLDRRESPLLVARQLLRDGPPSQALNAIVQAVLTEQPPGQTAGDAVGELRQRLASLVGENRVPSSDQLARYVRDGGVQYEAKLAHLAATTPESIPEMARGDIKALLLRALDEATSSQPTEQTGALTKTLTRHLQAVEAQQATNLVALAHGDPVQIQVPLMLETGHASTLLLGVRPDESGEPGTDREPSGHNILMHLDLSELGETRIDTHLTKSTLRAIFYLESSAGRAQVQAELPALREALNGLGFHEVLLGVRALDELPAEKDRDFAALAQGLPTSASLLDVRA